MYELDKNLEKEFQHKTWNLVELKDLGGNKQPYSVRCRC